MNTGWYRWTIDGWFSLDDHINQTINHWINQHTDPNDHNWYDSHDIFGKKYLYCYPTNEMNKQYNLFKGDIGMITKGLKCSLRGEFTIIRYIDDPAKLREIKGGKKSKFFQL